MVALIQEAEGPEKLIRITYCRSHSGKTTKEALKYGNGRRLAVRAVFTKLGRYSEQMLHEFFQNYRREDKWFDPCPQLIAFMKWAHSEPQATWEEVAYFLGITEDVPFN